MSIHNDCEKSREMPKVSRLIVFHSLRSEREIFWVIFYKKKDNKGGEGWSRSAEDKTTFDAIVQRHFCGIGKSTQRDELASNGCHCCNFFISQKPFFHPKNFSFLNEKSINLSDADARVRTSLYSFKDLKGILLSGEWKEAPS